MHAHFTFWLNAPGIFQKLLFQLLAVYFLSNSETYFICFFSLYSIIVFGLSHLYTPIVQEREGEGDRGGICSPVLEPCSVMPGSVM